MSGTFLSRFTPSLMSPEALEATFVQREELVRVILRRVREASTAPEKEHTLLVGPRGIGKTHLISLLHHRLLDNPELADRIAVAWLREEEWGVTTVLDVLLRTLRAEAGGSEHGEDQLEFLYSLAPEEAERRAAEMLAMRLGGRTLVLLVENLDDLCRGLGEHGQRQLRNFLAQHPYWLLIATAQTLWPGLNRAPSPFHGYFHIHQLEELSFQDACLLLSRIARQTGDRELAEFLTTPVGRARVRALEFLAGGNHRAYVIFSQFLTRNLQDIVDPLVRTIDDLTPYYQSRMATLRPEQRKVLEWLCERRCPVAAHEVAQRCFINSLAANSNLALLTEMGYLRCITLGGGRYYELKEPLMRLAIEVKRHDREPIRLLVEFLNLWYSPSELKHRLARLPREAKLECLYAAQAVQLAAHDHEDPRVAACSRGYQDALDDGDFGRALDFAEELTAFRDEPQDWFARAYCLVRLGRASDAVDCTARILEMEPASADGWALRAVLLHNLGHHEMALSACEKATQLNPASAEAHVTCAEILEAAGRYEDAGAAYRRALSCDSDDAAAHLGYGMVLSDLGRYEEALPFLNRATQLAPDNARALIYAAAAFVELKRDQEALDCAERAIRRSADDPLVWVVRGTALSNMSRRAEALEAFRRAMSLGENSSFVRFKEAELLLALQCWREGSTALDRALRDFAHSCHPDAGNTAAMVGTLAGLLTDPVRMDLGIRLLTLLYRKNRALRPLAQGVVDSMVALSGTQATLLRVWYEGWRLHAGTAAEFALALRLLATAVMYMETSDPRTLLGLAVEERRLIEPLVEVCALETA